MQQGDEVQSSKQVIPKEMDTIAINASEAHNEEDKKKFKVSDTAKAAMATGVAGAVAGAAGMYGADNLTADSEDDASAASGPESQQEEMTAEAEPVAEVTAEVNPDDVMLEEPVAEPSTETDMVVGTGPYHSEDAGYQPFASNDRIGEDVLPEPEPEEVLIAENTEEDMVIDSDPTVDMICGAIEEEAGLPDEVGQTDENLYADNGSVCDETDIQSDLMA